MLAVFTAPDAVVIAALLAAAGSQFATWRTARKAESAAREQQAVISKEFQPNGGSSLRDAVNRIERTLKHDVVPRLDHGAQVIAEHADRLAVLEAKPAKPRKATT